MKRSEFECSHWSPASRFDWELREHCSKFASSTRRKLAFPQRLLARSVEEINCKLSWIFCAFCSKIEKSRNATSRVPQKWHSWRATPWVGRGRVTTEATHDEPEIYVSLVAIIFFGNNSRRLNKFPSKSALSDIRADLFAVVRNGILSAIKNYSVVTSPKTKSSRDINCRSR